jgi:hypothetical protein
MNISNKSNINGLNDLTINLAAAGINIESMTLTGKNLELRLQDYDQFSDMCEVAASFTNEFIFTVPYKTAFTYADFQ